MNRVADAFFKLRVLVLFVGDAWHSWRRDVWPKSLDARCCCDGRECGCGGQTVRELWQGIYP